MAEGAYVNLNKTQNPLQEITPGELNQPIDVVAHYAPKCDTCGQVLPPTYIPPGDEDWTTGIFGCNEDTDSCRTGLFCPCVLFGRNVTKLTDEIDEQSACIGHAVCVEGGIALAIATAACSGMDPNLTFLLTEGLLFSWLVCATYSGIGRQALQRKYHLKDAPCGPLTVHCCLHWCAICQEHREMKKHISEEGVSSEATVINPPEIQQMNAAEKQEETGPSSAQQNNLQLQPL